MIRRPCLIFIAVTIIIIVAVVVFLLAPAPREHWCPGGIVVWGDRNYTDNTMIRNASEVTAVLPLYKELFLPNGTLKDGCRRSVEEQVGGGAGGGL